MTLWHAFLARLFDLCLAFDLFTRSRLGFGLWGFTGFFDRAALLSGFRARNTDFETRDFQVVVGNLFLHRVRIVHPLAVPHNPHLAIPTFGSAQLGAVACAVAVPFGRWLGAFVGTCFRTNAARHLRRLTNVASTKEPRNLRT